MNQSVCLTLLLLAVWVGFLYEHFFFVCHMTLLSRRRFLIVLHFLPHFSANWFSQHTFFFTCQSTRSTWQTNNDSNQPWQWTLRRYQDPEPEAAKGNSAVTGFIICTCAFPTVTGKNTSAAKKVEVFAQLPSAFPASPHRPLHLLPVTLWTTKRNYIFPISFWSNLLCCWLLSASITRRRCLQPCVSASC